MVRSSSGPFVVYDNQGNDPVYGDDGNDVVYAGDGINQVSGGYGDDADGGSQVNGDTLVPAATHGCEQQSCLFPTLNTAKPIANGSCSQSPRVAA